MSARPTKIINFVSDPSINYIPPGYGDVLVDYIKELEASLAEWKKEEILWKELERELLTDKKWLDKLDRIRNPEDQGEFICLWDEDFGDIRAAIDKLEEQ